MTDEDLDLSARRTNGMLNVWLHCVGVAEANGLCPVCLLLNLNRQVVAGVENGELHHKNHEKEIEGETIQ